MVVAWLEYHGNSHEYFKAGAIRHCSSRTTLPDIHSSVMIGTHFPLII
jgi:hypothetical protein